MIHTTRRLQSFKLPDLVSRWMLSLIIAASAAAQVHASGPAAPATAPQVPVLIYHEITTDGSPPGETRIALDRFAEQMAYLARQGYTPIDMDQLVAFMTRRATLPERPIVLTFDDGWRNVLNAIPVLERYRFKASFWIITGKGIGGDYLDWDDIDGIQRNPLFEVQSHTVTHPWNPRDNLITWLDGKVPGKSIATARAELLDSRQELLRRLHRSAKYLAWPCGWYTDALVQLAQEAGYEALLTAEAGLNTAGGDVLRIKRTFIDGQCTMADFAMTVADGKYRVCSAQGAPSLGRLPSQ